MKNGKLKRNLEIYDLLKKDSMTRAAKQKVKLAAKSLLQRLLKEHPKVLVQVWHKDSQTKSIVRSAVEQVLDDNPPHSYGHLIFKKKCDDVFKMIVRYADREVKWAA